MCLLSYTSFLSNILAWASPILSIALFPYLTLKYCSLNHSSYPFQPLPWDSNILGLALKFFPDPPTFFQNRTGTLLYCIIQLLQLLKWREYETSILLQKFKQWNRTRNRIWNKNDYGRISSGHIIPSLPLLHCWRSCQNFYSIPTHQ